MHHFLVASLSFVAFFQLSGFCSHGHLLGLTTLSPETFYTRDISHQSCSWNNSDLRKGDVLTQHKSKTNSVCPRYINSYGKRCTLGAEGLKRSEHYPQAFGRAHFDWWLSQRDQLRKSGSLGHSSILFCKKTGITCPLACLHVYH